MITKDKILLSDLLGKTFRYGGRGPIEYDCYGLCIEIYRRLDYTLPEFGSAVLPTVIDRMISEGKVLFQELSKPEPWSLVLFKIRPPYVSHIGVVLENCNQFIHIMRNTRVCIERLDALEWKNRIAGYYWLKL